MLKKVILLIIIAGICFASNTINYFNNNDVNLDKVIIQSFSINYLNLTISDEIKQYTTEKIYEKIVTLLKNKHQLIDNSVYRNNDLYKTLADKKTLVFLNYNHPKQKKNEVSSNILLDIISLPFQIIFIPFQIGIDIISPAFDFDNSALGVWNALAAEKLFIPKDSQYYNMDFGSYNMQLFDPEIRKKTIALCEELDIDGAYNIFIQIGQNLNHITAIIHLRLINRLGDYVYYGSIPAYVHKKESDTVSLNITEYREKLKIFYRDLGGIDVFNDAITALFFDNDLNKLRQIIKNDKLIDSIFPENIILKPINLNEKYEMLVKLFETIYKNNPIEYTYVFNHITDIRQKCSILLEPEMDFIPVINDSIQTYLNNPNVSFNNEILNTGQLVLPPILSVKNYEDLPPTIPSNNIPESRRFIENANVSKKVQIVLDKDVYLAMHFFIDIGNNFSKIENRNIKNELVDSSYLNKDSSYLKRHMKLYASEDIALLDFYTKEHTIVTNFKINLDNNVNSPEAEMFQLLSKKATKFSEFLYNSFHNDVFKENDLVVNIDLEINTDIQSKLLLSRQKMYETLNVLSFMSLFGLPFMLMYYNAYSDEVSKGEPQYIHKYSIEIDSVDIQDLIHNKLTYNDFMDKIRIYKINSEKIKNRISAKDIT
ncbi:MAG: hypothetical protein A2Y40_09525 [Candidatus Margulisbacteria bacterium GWF2_35_9]|nr:MAG: hypothetical protein A2Y40_09525 [Candidatus Margulisbacteria bacterium GWF2_35_9]